MAPDILSARDGGIATVTLFNPDKLNALNAAMWRRLAVVFTELDADTSLRCIVVRGEGANFAAGGDLLEMREARATRAGAMSYHATVATALDAIGNCRHPVVALIRGACVGGGLEIATACDLRIAGVSAQLGAPINRLGFSMYPGELDGLLRLVGPTVVKEILLEGRLLTAEEAGRKGLLTRVVPETELEGEVFATAQHIAAGAPLVARWHKQWIDRLMEGRPLDADELDASFAFLDSADYEEGLAAFFEKRTPRFTGR